MDTQIKANNQQNIINWESEEFNSFANFLQAMFPKENILEDTNDNKKMKLAYAGLISKKCTVQELKDTMNEFRDSHRNHFGWMPADILEAFKIATATSRFRL